MQTASRGFENLRGTLTDVCLGIECTAHTFGASVLIGKQIKSNVKELFTTTSGGMIPYHVGTHHVAVCKRVVMRALQEAGISMRDVDVISFSQSPGLGHALRVGALLVRQLALRFGKPVVGVNHCIAHLEIGQLLCDANDPILCYVSGANTQIIAFEGERYRIFGETLDIGIGNLLDSTARYMGLGFPGGPKIAQLAQQAVKDDYIALPYVVKGMDLSFAGLETTIKALLADGVAHHVVAYSLQETIYAMVVEVTERALAHCGKSEVLLGGGVACNTRLQEMMRMMCAQRNAVCYVLDNQYNVDNAAMIAWHGLQVFATQGSLSLEQTKFDPFLRTDEVVVTWR